ncbi:hypothetical protein [Legionella jamestowniensis]|uniref:Uncharacterized protein n=1 Tax=Legionella jamestowniensis TaxID=455 RepID=A0A0W0UW63_9GAMM|nr:hypothetical protein [Legionella jamestowniensis]KTD12115.1 hypothetical protein Ljam_0331 [Legionella jamestowniensis]OCH98846.1 hypothetical protein A8135_08770 [Legionella jamestowniensis]SFL72519.1 hypothetical protein SAMN02746073_1654 [Legionella jamestowniensis DSM 19215]
MTFTSFFTSPSKKLFDHHTTLISHISKSVTFNPNDLGHTTLVKEATALVTEKLHALQSLDTKIAASFSIGTLAWGLSFILPVGFFAAGCFAYGAYQLGQRKAAYAEYTSALENLSMCCTWTLGNVETRKMETFKNIEVLNGMITTLAPITSAQQLRDFIDDKIEDHFVEHAKAVKEHITLFDRELNPEENKLYFKIYGYKQGNFLDILQGIAFAIKNSFRAVGQIFSRDSAEESSYTPV